MGNFPNKGQMFQTTCADCGNSCSVPFQPREGRPVYCKDCFGKHNAKDTRQNFGDKPMFSAKCDNCGNACEVPFRPTGQKPVYCRDCFSKKGGRSDTRRPEQSGASAQYNDQFRAVNAKLDAILAVLAPAKKSVVKEDTRKKLVKVKKAGKKKK